MKIGIIGAGYMGAILVRKLSAAGHSILIANSRGLETLKYLAEDTNTFQTTS
ncbi:MAG: NAD(P)-binding domain-containing protein [Nostoc sp.]|uniref:NAD(P)-binding domain-containing protein n=1 Tax=unclassified Nostoc TaxID=2593658 RepID=UPI0025D1424B|nr:NAD(P)-binding domain-containing protein [Nostoc sp. NMS7]MBN3948345.1 NAD(P)-binding domain-containing protein [Nostoc sp. NMS7]